MGQPYRHMAADQQARQADRYMPLWPLFWSPPPRSAQVSRPVVPAVGLHAWTLSCPHALPLARAWCWSNPSSTHGTGRPCQRVAFHNLVVSRLNPARSFPGLQVSGAAQYVDDIQLPAGSLHAALVLSMKPHARIVRLDTAAAAAMPGVHGIYTGASMRHGGSLRANWHLGSLLGSPALPGTLLAATYCWRLATMSLSCRLRPCCCTCCCSQGCAWRQRHRARDAR